MSYLRDDWHKPRSEGTHLSRSELEALKEAFRARLTPKEAARAIACSSRTARRRFEQFRDEGVLEEDPPPRRITREQRFYHGSFEL
jgi:response regulator of citrate/malate metabolism